MSRIISPHEKTTDMKGRTIRPGDFVTHYKFGRGEIVSVDLKTYSIPFLIVNLSGKHTGEKIYRAANEFEKDFGRREGMKHTIAEETRIELEDKTLILEAGDKIICNEGALRDKPCTTM